MARAGNLVLSLLLLLGLLTTSFASCEVSRGGREMEPREREEEERGRRRHRGREEKEERGYPQIELGRPREQLQSEGGRLRVWSEEIDAIRNAHVGIAELELEENGLLVPQYSDADKIAYVLQGSGKMGAVIPGAESEYRRTYIRKVQRGDVVALPKGTVYWWYNDGNERHRVLCAGDTSYGANPGRFHQFGLAGSKQARFGSVLHGFSKDTLATAWGVDEQTIQSLLERQNEAGIVKAKQKIHFPQIPERRSRREEEDERNTLKETSGPFHFEELKYSIRDEFPDFYVKNGGALNRVNCHKLPALHQIGFSAVKVSLEKNAMMAPSFVRNGHQIFYFIRGNGRVQVASGDGENVFDQEVREGTVLVIPQFFPSVKIAGDQGLEWIELVTSSSPRTTFLAGKNSVYRGIPKQVTAAAFNVDEEQLRELGRDEEEQRRRREEEERRKHQRELPAWALASLEVL
ncbi:hypothetical protein GOP47_0029698 [Adiantum capillus-veneris]|nr:hypothetical protein GOP47_0029698 [Adiantum capillus-veneris]